MKKALMIVSAGVLLSACQSVPMAENAVQIEVEFHWTAQSGCRPVSPPITLSNVPQQTAYLDIRMKDLNVPSYNHGGGKVAYEGQSEIPEGALSTYKGPCPPAGSHNYQISVNALNAEGNLILGQGSSTLPFSQ